MISGLGITLLSILLIYVLRNIFGGQGWDGLGLEWKWNKLGDFVGGVVLGVVSLVLANYIIVEVGIANWRPAAEIEAELAVSVLISGFITTVLVQALPESYGSVVTSMIRWLRITR